VKPMTRGVRPLLLERLDRQMTEKSLLKIGIVGTIITAICCFTPLLVVVLGVIGLSSLIGLLDLVLLPALAIFLLITGYGLWKRRRTA
jgi:mercuric ion transport protein